MSQVGSGDKRCVCVWGGGGAEKGSREVAWSAGGEEGVLMMWLPCIHVATGCTDDVALMWLSCSLLSA